MWKDNRNTLTSSHLLAGTLSSSLLLLVAISIFFPSSSQSFTITTTALNIRAAIHLVFCPLAAQRHLITTACLRDLCRRRQGLHCFLVLLMLPRNCQRPGSGTHIQTRSLLWEDQHTTGSALAGLNPNEVVSYRFLIQQNCRFCLFFQTSRNRHLEASSKARLDHHSQQQPWRPSDH